MDEMNVASYADDNRPYTIETNITSFVEVIETDAAILIKWFRNNYLKMNEDKCHLLITNQEDGCISASIRKENMVNSKSEKMLGITIDSKLNFNEHISMLCKQVNLKLHALARISKFMNTVKLRMIMKAFIESQFGYCPPPPPP